MPDFGQYSEKNFFNKLKASTNQPGSGKCDRCGRKTRTRTIFGMTVCNDCWRKQTGGLKG